jgi:hypothetical protein
MPFVDALLFFDKTITFSLARDSRSFLSFICASISTSTVLDTLYLLFTVQLHLIYIEFLFLYSIKIMSDSSEPSVRSPGSVFSAPGSAPDTPRSPSPDPLPPPPPPPPPPAPPFPQQCEDAPHCDPTGIRCRGAYHVCPGFDPAGMNIPYTSALVHPGPPASMLGFACRVCNHCLNHDNNFPHPPKHLLVKQIANANSHSGNLIQLCHTCIRDEIELYWQRIHSNPPPLASAAPSLTRIGHWPTRDHPYQNLCICSTVAINAYTHHCHACRDAAFTQHFSATSFRNERFLRTKTKPVLTGKKLCNLHSPLRPGHTHPPHSVSGRTINARMNADIGRLCPCGERPKAPENFGEEYILYCIACSGVRVNPNRLPEQYQERNMPLRRRSPRGHGMGRTKGPVRAFRSHLYRVNIERGWYQGGDPAIGGA